MIEITAGVFQDDTLTSSLSTISLDSAMRQDLETHDNPILFQIKKSGSRNPMIQIGDLGFDLDMVVTLNQEAQTLLQRVEDASASVRLSLNLGNC